MLRKYLVEYKVRGRENRKYITVVEGYYKEEIESKFFALRGNKFELFTVTNVIPIRKKLFEKKKIYRVEGENLIRGNIFRMTVDYYEVKNMAEAIQRFEESHRWYESQICSVRKN